MNRGNATLAALRARCDLSWGDCWLWEGAVSSAGYGLIRLQHGGSPTLVHRLAYELFHGSIPEGMEVDHLCAQRRCCNPLGHLEAVPKAVNVQRAVANRMRPLSQRLPKQVRTMSSNGSYRRSVLSS